VLLTWRRGKAVIPLDVLASASEVSIIATDPDGLITVFNRGAERLLGYSANEMVGKTDTGPSCMCPKRWWHEAMRSANQFGRPIEGFRVFVEWPSGMVRKRVNGPMSIRTAISSRFRWW